MWWPRTGTEDRGARKTPGSVASGPLHFSVRLKRGSYDVEGGVAILYTVGIQDDAQEDRAGVAAAANFRNQIITKLF